MKKRVTIRELADSLGVSICTVNKALYNKPKIGEETRKRVLDAARSMGYRPNRLAQTLVRRALLIGVIYPDNFWPSYYEPLLAGVREGLAAFEDHNIAAHFEVVQDPLRVGSYEQTISTFLDEKPDGLIICPSSVAPDAALWEKLRERRIPFVFLGNSIAGVPSLCAVRHDGQRCGRMAAEILAKINGGKPAAILVGSRAIVDHRDKLTGFTAEALRSNMPVSGVYETHDDPALAHRVTRQLFADHPDVGGLYIGTDNGVGPCRFLIEEGHAGKVSVVATNAFAEMRDFLLQNVVQFTLYQNMIAQGKQAIRVLYRFLTEGVQPDPQVLVAPLIVTRNSLDLW
jgi:LacI family transcriptional regulator